MIAHALLKLYSVSVGYGHVVHVHAEHETAHVLCVCHTGCHSCPYCNLLLRVLALPVAANHFARNAHAGADVAELNVAVGRLVEVHEVHVYGFPGNLGVVLGVEVEEWLLQCLQTLYPHFCGREGVHPSDDADTLVLVVGCLHHLFHLL